MKKSVYNSGLISVCHKGKIDTSKYVNIETGELLSDEHNGSVISFKKSTDLVVLSSEEFVVIDSVSMRNVTSGLNNAEIGRVLMMSNMVKSQYNLLFDSKNKKFYTKKSIMEELDYTRNKFSDFMKKMIDLSILCYVNGYDDDQECDWIMMNPTLARKSKSFNRFCLNSFKNLSKEEPKE